MRMLGCCLIAACAFSSGCEWLNRKKDVVEPPANLNAYGPPRAENLVGYLNRQADQLAVIESHDVGLTAFVQGKRMPELRGSMVCEKPRNFRLMGDAVGQQYVDIGSNDDKFWFWVKDGDAPLYFCTYADYERGVPLPLPFQPEWVVQALGMAKYDPNKPYRVEVKGNSVELIEETTLQGKPVRKITVFNTRRVSDPTQPQVTAHLVQDAASGKTICQATIRRVRLANYRTAQGEVSVAYPSDVLLEWPAEQLSMRLTVGKSTVNQPLNADAQGRYFSLPKWDHIRSIDLAKMRPGSPTGRDIRQAGGQ